MKIENGENYINIEFCCYANEDLFIPANLKDIQNSVSIDFDFYVQEVGWGEAGGQHFFTKDILALFKGFASVYSKENIRFSYSGEFSCGSSYDEPFYAFLVDRQDDIITFTLKIHDCLIEYIQVTERMTVSRFEEIVNEFEKAVKRFPVI